MQQLRKLNELESAFENERKKNQENTATFESMVQYLRRDCLEISGIPPSEDYSTNDFVIAGLQILKKIKTLSAVRATF